MQTFLPYSDFQKSAQCLDMRRLGKQRVEAWTIYLALTQGNRWKNHPAVKMWEGYTVALLWYGLAICEEWVRRGYKDTLKPRFEEKLKKQQLGIEMSIGGVGEWVFARYKYLPKWLGDENFHASHRSNLLRKNQEWYGKFGWGEPNDLPYCWPIKKTKNENS